jgi:four helix bundle protein
MTSSELQDRLIDFAVLTFELTNNIKKVPAGVNLINQIVRSATSPALNYGEAISAESSKDFIHKMQIVLKELRETWVSLEIIKRAALSKDSELLNKTIDECNQLISIFVKSVNTAKSK